MKLTNESVTLFTQTTLHWWLDVCFPMDSDIEKNDNDRLETFPGSQVSWTVLVVTSVASYLLAIVTVCQLS